MGKCYRHFTIKDRIKLYELLFDGTPIIEIANHLGFHKATIYRELERKSWLPLQATKMRQPVLLLDPDTF